jgi:hypothetical protein
MNTNYIPFPTGAKRFHLRYDLPEEFCFPEYACSPEIQRRTFDAARLGQPLPNPFPDDPAVDLRAYNRGRLYVYRGIGFKGSPCCHSLITDGQVHQLVPTEGLFSDLLARAERAYGELIRPLLYPAIQAVPFKDHTYTNLVILHDTEAESAAILPIHAACSYLKPRRAQS